MMDKFLRLVMETTVAGEKYSVYINAGQTTKIAVRFSDNEARIIYNGGAHFSTDLATRKAIKYAFGLETFRK